jgi:hypothetical protein
LAIAPPARDPRHPPSSCRRHAKSDAGQQAKKPRALNQCRYQIRIITGTVSNVNDSDYRLYYFYLPLGVNRGRKTIP